MRGGNIIHCFDPTTSAVYHYRLQTDGTLLAAGVHTPGVTGYRGGAYNSFENVIYILDSTANVIRPHLANLDSSSIQMTPLGSPVSVPATADQIYVDGSGKFLLASSTSSVSLYAIESNQVSLTFIGTQSVPNINDAVIYNQSFF